MGPSGCCAGQLLGCCVDALQPGGFDKHLGLHLTQVVYSAPELDGYIQIESSCDWLSSSRSGRACVAGQAGGGRGR